MTGARCARCEESVAADDVHPGPDGESLCESCYDWERTEGGDASCSCHVSPPCSVCAPDWELAS